MSNSALIPVILCGGEGSRLWPLSRKQLPKPYVTLSNGETLLQKTAQRVKALQPERALVVANAQHLYPTLEQIATLNHTAIDILLEPQPRDTAPAVALAIAHLVAQGVAADRFVLILPADHLITPHARFCSDIHKAVQETEGRSVLSLFGISPSHPHSGFGYILSEGDNVTFIEKPQPQYAAELITAGALWNSGIFLATLHHLVDLLKTHTPALWQWAQQVVSGAQAQQLQSATVISPEPDLFGAVTPISFDYAVVEKTPDLNVHRARFNWSDVGSWSALFQQLPRDSQDNAIFTEDDASQVCLNDSQNVSVWAEGERMVAVNGLKDILVVDMPDVVLVSHPDANDSLKALYKRLSQQAHPVVTENPVAMRPWGHYIVLHATSGYKVKKIVVSPGQKLSYQSHQHRHEHWVVVKGQAEVILEGRAHQLGENESIYIPAGAKHRLVNAGEDVLEVVEVQLGSYLGEDDIIRYEDDYTR